MVDEALSQAAHPPGKVIVYERGEKGGVKHSMKPVSTITHRADEPPCWLHAVGGLPEHVTLSHEVAFVPAVLQGRDVYWQDLMDRSPTVRAGEQGPASAGSSTYL